MATGGTIHLLVANPVDIATPSTGHIAFFADSTNSNLPSYKDDTGAVFVLTGPAGSPGGQGSMGPPGIPPEEDEPPEPIYVPGPRGETGLVGPTGPAGASSSAAMPTQEFDNEFPDHEHLFVPAAAQQNSGGGLADGDYGDFTVASGVATIDHNTTVYIGAAHAALALQITGQGY